MERIAWEILSPSLLYNFKRTQGLKRKQQRKLLTEVIALPSDTFLSYFGWKTAFSFTESCRHQLAVLLWPIDITSPNPCFSFVKMWSTPLPRRFQEKTHLQVGGLFLSLLAFSQKLYTYTHMSFEITIEHWETSPTDVPKRKGYIFSFWFGLGTILLEGRGWTRTISYYPL